MAILAGIDGCPFGWVCVIQDTEKPSPRVVLAKYLKDFFTQCKPDLVCIDIPIGLPDVGERRCDKEARSRLGWPRCTSVFTPPLRTALLAGSYQEASEIRFQLEGKKYPKQSFAIFGKTREVDEFVRECDPKQERIFEVHPEVCFMMLNKGEALAKKKKSPEGASKREALIRQVFPSLEYPAHAKSICGKDDVLDAFVALWTANRIAQGNELVLPTQEQKDTYGLRMEMRA
mgnify:CR=1 FL=1